MRRVKPAGLLSASFLLVLALPAFALESDNFTYTVSRVDTITITGYAGSGGPVIIPSILEGRPVVGIGAGGVSQSQPFDQRDHPGRCDQHRAFRVLWVPGPAVRIFQRACAAYGVICFCRLRKRLYPIRCFRQHGFYLSEMVWLSDCRMH